MARFAQTLVWNGRVRRNSTGEKRLPFLFLSISLQKGMIYQDRLGINPVRKRAQKECGRFHTGCSERPRAAKSKRNLSCTPSYSSKWGQGPEAEAVGRGVLG